MRADLLLEKKIKNNVECYANDGTIYNSWDVMYRVGPSRVERLSRSKVIAIVVFVFHWKWNWNLINVALWVCHCYCCCWRWVRTAATQQDCSTSNHNLPLMSICDDGKQKPILPTNWKCSTDFCTPKRFPPYVSCTNLDDFYWNRIHTLSEMIFFVCVLFWMGKFIAGSSVTRRLLSMPDIFRLE